jgi:cyclic pyranopterin phosphate synthase
MIDRFGRQVNYLRISVTDRCNLRCRYCLPETGVQLLRHDELLSYEEILEVAQEAVRLGICKIRLTGGEPLVRRNVVALVGKLAEVPGVADLSMTTNGTLLAQHASGLRAAGLHRVNISLDTTDPDRYRHLTRGGEVSQVLDGINAVLAAGFRQIKLNCVVTESSSETDAQTLRALGRQLGLEVRFIRRMDLAGGVFAPVEGGSGGDCRICNRLRLSSNGQIRPCLFSDLAFSVRELGARESLLRALAHKPESGDVCSNATISQVGG